MAKWEYRTAVARSQGAFGHANLVVLSIDGDIDAPILQKAKKLFDSHQFISLDSYLKLAGEDEWEAIGVSPTETGGSNRGPVCFLVLLKREIH
jgi:hypothetical protein